MTSPLRLSLVACLAATLSFASAQHTPDPNVIPGDIIVMLDRNTKPETLVHDLAMIHGEPSGLRVVKLVSEPMSAWLLHFDNASIPQQRVLNEVKHYRGVMLAQNNHIVTDRVMPDDDGYGDQWQHQNIDSEGAWDISTGGVTASGDTIVVCIVENADLPHPDLIDNAWFNHIEIPNDGEDNDDNGYVDDFRGWNPGGNDDVVYGGGHGTQVAGMIGAKGNNGSQVAGANWDVKLMVVTRNGIDEANVVESYTYPLVMRRMYNSTGGQKGAFVVATNASWGIDNADPLDFPIWCAMYDTLGTAGILSCGATANNAVDIDAVGDMPTGCSSDFMISVTATDVDDNRTFSAWGLTTIDVGAPGDQVFTTAMGGGTTFTSGTSFASPLTAGVIGLLYSAPCETMMSLVHSDPAEGALYVRQALFDGVEQVGNLPGNTVTGGRINAANSMQLLMDQCGTCPSPYNLGALNTAIGEATLSWTNVNGDVFDIVVVEVGGDTIASVNDNPGTEYTITGLQACTQYQFTVSADCGGGDVSAWSDTFTWTSEGCCASPSDLSLGFMGDNTGNLFWTAVLASTFYEVQYSVQGQNNWTTVTGITNDFLEITGLTACTDYDVQIRSNCNGNFTDWSPIVLMHTTGCGQCVEGNYCESVGADASEEWIQRVQLSNIDNNSGNNDGYAPFTDQGTSLTIGLAYPIVLTPGYAGQQYEEWFTVWMDLDGDGQFLGAAEKILDEGQAAAGAFTSTLTVPLGTTPISTRMRVIMKFNDNVADGCETDYDYGETEDYCVNLEVGSGMDELSGAVNVTVWPNPANDEVTLIAAANGPVEVVNALGQVVDRATLLNGRGVLNTAHLEEGLYHLRGVGVNGHFVVLHR